MDRFRRPRLNATLRDGRRDWYRITNNAGSADVYLFDEVGYWGTSAQQFVDELKAITAPTINLHVNSPGGEVFDGLAIYNTLKAHPAHVHAQVHGLAASAASFIIQAADRITVARNAVIMIHDAAGLAIGDSRVMRELADLLDKLSDNCADIYAQRAGGTVAEWRERMLAETWYTGSEAVAAGLADEMTDPDPEPAGDAPAEMANSWDLSVFRYAGRENAPAPTGRAAAAPAPEVRGLAPEGTVSGGAEPTVEPPPAPAHGGTITTTAPFAAGETGCSLTIPSAPTMAGGISHPVTITWAGEHGPELVDLAALARMVDAATATEAAAEEAAHATDDEEPAEPEDWAATVAVLTAPDPWAGLVKQFDSLKEAMQ